MRHTKLKLVFGLAVIFMFLAAPNVHSAESANTTQEWLTDWDTAFTRAADEDKLVFVDFWAECGPCKRMDSLTLPHSSVRPLLADFVLLRVDGKKDSVRARQYHVAGYPSYLVFDPWERMRFRVEGFQPPDRFATRINFVRRASPSILDAGRMLNEAKTATAFYTLGNGYLAALSVEDARNAFSDARKLAKKEKNAELEQIATGQYALTLGLERKPKKTKKAIQILEEIVRDPASPRNGTSALIVLGRVYEMNGDPAAARKAYLTALDACPEGSDLKREAETALALLSPTD